MNNKVILLAIGVLICVGLGCFFYPEIIYFLASQKQAKVIETYEMSAEAMNDERLKTEYQQSQAYNQSLKDQILWDSFGENQNKLLDGYLDVLNVGGIMGVLEVPKINVNLPIYHGTSDAILDKGVGHMKNSALPIGGVGTHAVLTGHRGYAGAKLFTDLDQLILGDRFYLHVLDQTLIYEVDQVLVVTPDQTDPLKAMDKKDYVTLLTCTPYGINSHRLLVRGVRIFEAVRTSLPEEKPTTINVKALILTFFLLEGITFLIWYIKKRRR